MKYARILLLIIAVVCIGVAVSYPLRYQKELEENNEELGELSAMRKRVRTEQGIEGVSQSDGSWEFVTPETDDGQPALDEGTTPKPDDGQPAPDEGVTPEPEDGQPAPDEGATPKPDDGQPAPEEGRTPEPEDGQPAPDEGRTPEPIEAIEAGPAGEETPTPEPTPTPKPTFTPTPRPTLPPGVTPSPSPDIMQLIVNDPEMLTPTPSPSPSPSPTPSPEPSPTPDRSIRTGALPYNLKQKVELDESKILPELREIYALNHDLVGWIFIEDTLVDYPVVQTEDSLFYLKHDFYGKDNANGQIILDTNCDPYTPSYNLVISGHHMNSGAMFGKLLQYKDKKYWQAHRFVEFDTLMERKAYVVFAAFNSADYDENEEGFRYNVDIQYKIDADQWLAEIEENKFYDTGIDVEFGDEFITLTTCDRARRRNGRFVVVARRIREGEKFE